METFLPQENAEGAQKAQSNALTADWKGFATKWKFASA